VDGQSLWNKNDAATPSSYVIFRENGAQLLFVDANGAHVRRAESGEAVLYLTAHQVSTRTEWTAWSPSGRFDGSDEGIRHLRYVAKDPSSAPHPVDGLVRDYFTPGLAGSVLRSIALAAIAPRDPASSGQTIGLSVTGTSGKSVDVAVNVIAATKKGHASVRLCRNGLLVKRWQSVELTNTSGTVTLAATVNLISGMNHLLAYSYDDGGLKSADATVDCEGPKTVEPGTLHVLAGVYCEAGSYC
jgi:hypothetical protein